MPEPIDYLRRQKSLNVEQQVTVTRFDIHREASWWRGNPVTPAIHEAISQQGFDICRSILIDVCDREFGLEECTYGTLVTNTERFIKFSIELSSDGSKLIAIHHFNDITDTLDICGRKPGFGATRPFLALEVLRELNGEKGY